MTYTPPQPDPYQPRPGDGSLPEEDDALLRQPADEVSADPDVENDALTTDLDPADRSETAD